MTDTETGPEPGIPAALPEWPVPSWLARLWRGLRRHPRAVLAAFCLMLWLPGVVSLPPLDRDESRFAQSARQMLDSGNWIDIRFGREPRYKKPVGIYWLQAAATAIAGGGAHGHIWTYRLPSLLAGILAAWLTAWCGTAFGADVALLAGFLMASSVLLTAEATIATTDAVLLAATLAVQGVLMRAYRAARADEAPPPTRLVLAGWAALAGGILVKGPVTPAVAGVTVIALLVWDRLSPPPGPEEPGWRWLMTLRPVWGLLLTLLLVLPWLVAIAVTSHGAFFQQSLGHDFAAKMAGGQESHGAPPGYFLLLSALSFWPAILFVAPGIGQGLARRAEPGVRFLLAWAGAWWLVVEAVPTKLPHYVLPAYPALAVLAALWVAAPRPAQGWRRLLPPIAAVQFLIGLAALALAPVLLPEFYGAAAAWGLALPALTGAACGIGALWLMPRARMAAALMALLASLLLLPALTAGAGPRLTQLWMSQRLAALVARDSRPGDPPPALAGYEEPSLVFALGADVGLTNGAGAAEAGAGHGGLVLVSDAERPRFLMRLAQLQARAKPVDDLTGFDYSRGHRVHVTLYRVTAAAPGSWPLP